MYIMQSAMEHITEFNFKHVAEQYYDNPQCFAFTEFEQDLRRFTYVSNLLDKYNKTSILQERLILNHIIIIHNIFGNFTAPGLFYKTNELHWPILKTFLSFLQYIPTEMPQYNIKDNEDLLKVLNNL